MKNRSLTKEKKKNIIIIIIKKEKKIKMERKKGWEKRERHGGNLFVKKYSTHPHDSSIVTIIVVTRSISKFLRYIEIYIYIYIISSRWFLKEREKEWWENATIAVLNTSIRWKKGLIQEKEGIKKIDVKFRHEEQKKIENERKTSDY